MTVPWVSVDASAQEDADDERFQDAFSENADIDQFSSPEDPLSCDDILSFPSDNQSTLHEVALRIVVVDGGDSSVERGAGGVAPDPVVSSLVSPSKSSLRSGPSETSMDTSVSQKRKDRSLPELSRSLSTDVLSGCSCRKAFKPPAP